MVTLVAMVVEFVETLEMKIKTVHSIPTTEESMRNLVSTVNTQTLRASPVCNLLRLI